MKEATTWILLGLGFFTAIFGAYQIFIDDVSALPVCGELKECMDWGQNCPGGTYVCRCQGGPLLFYCFPGDPTLP